MSPGTLSRPARRLHGVTIALLTLQLILLGGGHPLMWGGLLLTLMAGLKLAESRRGQDLQRAALAELMAVGVLAVIAPELGPSLLQASTALVVVAALLCQEAGDRRSLGQALRRSLQLGLASLPLLLLLFLLMPRIGPLWTVPGQGAGRTGL
ncbi:MAG: transglutaminaseTgpA domain-containing protein, partial [Cyanobium sp.]